MPRNNHHFFKVSSASSAAAAAAPLPPLPPLPPYYTSIASPAATTPHAESGGNSINQQLQQEGFAQFDLKQKKYQSREIYRMSGYTYKPRDLVERSSAATLGLKDIENDLDLVDVQAYTNHYIPAAQNNLVNTSQISM